MSKEARKFPARRSICLVAAILHRPSSHLSCVGAVGATFALPVLTPATSPLPDAPTAWRRTCGAFAYLGAVYSSSSPLVETVCAVAGKGDATTADNSVIEGDSLFTVVSFPPPERSKKSLGKLAAGRARWYDRLEDLRSFIAENGHAAVPQSRSDGLAGWVAAQRSNYAKWQRDGGGALTDDRREALEKLDGFDWDVNDALWRSNLESLRRYREDNGTANIPHSGGSLGRWVHVQRLEYNRWRRALDSAGVENYAGSMTFDRAAMLEEAGMEWDPRQKQFDEMVDALRRFRDTTGHINVGARKGRLSAWFYRQRRAYRDMLEGKNSSAMTKERTAVLEELGFRPDMFSNRTKALSLAREQNQKKTPKIKVSWDRSFEKLKRYQRNNGHCNVPQLEGKLGRFVRHQRQLMMERQRHGAQTTLTDERIEKLESIGFIWDLNEFRWNEKLQQLRDYAEENGGTCNVPQSYGELGDWCETQREQYVLKRNGKSTFLTHEREKALTKLGFTWRRGEQVRSRREENWNRKLKELKKYKATHGHCRVPRSHELANWVNRQRSGYRSLLRGEKSFITEERRIELSKIGFE